MSEYGHRYVEVSRFVSHCKSLNIDVSERELEFADFLERLGDDEVVSFAKNWRDVLNLFKLCAHLAS